MTQSVSASEQRTGSRATERQGGRQQECRRAERKSGPVSELDLRLPEVRSLLHADIRLLPVPQEQAEERCEADAVDQEVRERAVCLCSLGAFCGDLGDAQEQSNEAPEARGCKEGESQWTGQEVLQKVLGVPKLIFEASLACFGLVVGICKCCCRWM